MSTREPVIVVILLLAGIVPLGAPVSGAAPIELQLVAVSDWHGQLDPVQGVGAASILSTYFQQERQRNPNTLTLTAGDAFGASPPLAAYFDEVPAVKAMNLMGFDADTLGNHNFDRGVDHMRRMMELAEFPYVAANVVDPDGELPGLERYRIFDLGGVKVAVIGIMNEEAPSLLLPGAMGNLQLTDGVEAANAARADAEAEGAHVFVCLVHKGLSILEEDAEGNVVTAAGPLVDFAQGLTGFDVVFGDHTNFLWSDTIHGALVVENHSKGVSYSRITVSVDPTTLDVVGKDLVTVTPYLPGIRPDARVEEMLLPYREELARIFDVPVGEVAGVFERGGNVERVREVPIGNLVTDSMRQRYGTQLAFTNGGGIRAPIPSAYLPNDHSLRRNVGGYGGGPPYDIVVGDIYTVLPFGNTVVTRNVTGEQVHAIMEWALDQYPRAAGKFAQVSGMTVYFDSRQPPGERVASIIWHPDVPRSVEVDGAGTLEAPAAAEVGGERHEVPRSAGAPPVAGVTRDESVLYRFELPCPAVAPPYVCAKPVVVKGRPGVPIQRDDRVWTLATNDFVNLGGDGYTMLVGSGDPVSRDLMAEVLKDHVAALTAAHGPLVPATEDRIMDLAPKVEQAEKAVGRLVPVGV